MFCDQYKYFSGIGKAFKTQVEMHPEAHLRLSKYIFINLIWLAAFVAKSLSLVYLVFSESVMRMSAEGLNSLCCHVPETHGSLSTGTVITG